MVGIAIVSSSPCRPIAPRPQKRNTVPTTTIAASTIYVCVRVIPVGTLSSNSVPNHRATCRGSAQQPGGLGPVTAGIVGTELIAGAVSADAPRAHRRSTATFAGCGRGDLRDTQGLIHGVSDWLIHCLLIRAFLNEHRHPQHNSAIEPDVRPGVEQIREHNRHRQRQHAEHERQQMRTGFLVRHRDRAKHGPLNGSEDRHEQRHSDDAKVEQCAEVVIVRRVAERA